MPYRVCSLVEVYHHSTGQFNNLDQIPAPVFTALSMALKVTTWLGYREAVGDAFHVLAKRHSLFDSLIRPAYDLKRRVLRNPLLRPLQTHSFLKEDLHDESSFYCPGRDGGRPLRQP